jgi:hypothetical protein
MPRFPSCLEQILVASTTTTSPRKSTSLTFVVRVSVAAGALNLANIGLELLEIAKAPVNRQLESLPEERAIDVLLV